MQSKILLPLYIYPAPGAWDALYAAISSHPNLQFMIIVNPNSGPGYAPWWPNEDYVREIPRLNAFANVTAVGYVCATYCKRSPKLVFKDIEEYAARTREGFSTGLEMQGIFLDETLNVFDGDVKQYLDEIDANIKGAQGISGDKLVIHNPGTAVDARLADPGPDVTVVVETSYAHFMTAEYQDWLATSPYNRSRAAYMLYGVPKDEVRTLTTSLRDKAKYLFVTSATDKVYEGFGPSWEVFVEAMAKS